MEDCCLTMKLDVFWLEIGRGSWVGGRGAVLEQSDCTDLAEWDNTDRIWHLNMVIISKDIKFGQELDSGGGK